MLFWANMRFAPVITSVRLWRVSQSTASDFAASASAPGRSSLLLAMVVLNFRLLPHRSLRAPRSAPVDERGAVFDPDTNPSPGNTQRAHPSSRIVAIFTKVAGGKQLPGELRLPKGRALNVAYCGAMLARANAILANSRWGILSGRAPIGAAEVGRGSDRLPRLCYFSNRVTPAWEPSTPSWVGVFPGRNTVCARGEKVADRSFFAGAGLSRFSPIA